MLFWYGVRRASIGPVPVRATGIPYSARAVSSPVEKQPATSAGRSRSYRVSASTGASSTVIRAPSRAASASAPREYAAGAEGAV